jgi:hypothetical protein
MIGEMFRPFWGNHLATALRTLIHGYSIHLRSLHSRPFLNSEWLQNYDGLRGGGLALAPFESPGATQLSFGGHG